MKFVAKACVFLLVALTLCDGSVARSRRSHGGPVPAAATAAETQIKDKLNAWTVGLAGGLLEGAPIHFATDIARVVSNG
ncbi:MAG TPA: C4-dicarboxylate ABC transporter substrate-binding protein, partial [Bradyrhizobium sp.]